MGGSRVKLAVVENGAIVENEIFPVPDDGFAATLAELERRISVPFVHLYDSETVIWSGGASHFAPLLDAAQEYVWTHSWTPWGKVRFVVADNPEVSVVLGLHALFAEVPAQ